MRAQATSGQGTRAACGHEPATGLYYERLGGLGSSGGSTDLRLRGSDVEGGRSIGAAPLLLIHGGGATGACWRLTPDGRAGWADLLAAAGHRVWVTDWPGTGRSGNQDPVDVGYPEVVEGYRRLLRDVIGEPAVVVCHSMGGAVTWQLVEHEPDLVAGVVAVAAAYPANLSKPSTIVSEDGDEVVVRFADTGVDMTVNRSRVNLYGDGYIYEQGLATSTRFPRHLVDHMRAGLVGLPPKMFLQRLGVLEGMPKVNDPAGFQGARIRLVAGGEDPAHTRAIEDRTVELLRSWGADAELVFLPDRGIHGNGHFLFYEDNSEEILDVAAEQIAAVTGTTRPAGGSA